MTRLVAPLLVLLAAAPAHAQRLTVVGGPADAAQVVVSTPLPATTSVAPNAVTLPDGTHVPAQVVPPALADKGKGSRLVFVLPQMKAGAEVAVLPTMLNYVKAPPQFQFAQQAGLTNVAFDGRSVLQFFAPRHDEKDHYYTFKPFHHVFDPTGKVLLTNGSAKDPKDGTFPHHRGLFFAWNKINYGDKKTADVWHGTNKVFAEAREMTEMVGGEVLGRHRAAITWNGPDGAAFATEEREVTAYATKGGTLIDFASVVRTELPSVKLDGDPQHAGFHFRANMEVALKNAKQTYYLRPDGKGELGATRNWDPKGKDPKTINLPWDACSFVVGGKRYTVLRVGHPDNPGEARGSERDYGRFGDYFEYEITPQKPLRVRYRVWAQEGEMTAAEAAAIAAAFRAPVAVK
ncbi:DUF6807 family protein [Urbifossiella limnaea]|uniref:Methane oxygenase PmoA n=1 Tax=Urbifossiella limnaea TaxID=2528023 RepID=A0A517Y1A0_9BACT|nr:DUF6807 family protein [Urbifossiella limnaea]QDU23539.1 hypothetical protein ETAA1_55400 [Urbifossiella limnaea]